MQQNQAKSNIYTFAKYGSKSIRVWAKFAGAGPGAGEGAAEPAPPPLPGGGADRCAQQDRQPPPQRHGDDRVGLHTPQEGADAAAAAGTATAAAAGGATGTAEEPASCSCGVWGHAASCSSAPACCESSLAFLCCWHRWEEARGVWGRGGGQGGAGTKSSPGFFLGGGPGWYQEGTNLTTGEEGGGWRVGHSHGVLLAATRA